MVLDGSGELGSGRRPEGKKSREGKAAVWSCLALAFRVPGRSPDLRIAGEARLPIPEGNSGNRGPPPPRLQWRAVLESHQLPNTSGERTHRPSRIQRNFIRLKEEVGRDFPRWV